jgi:hypothetical protein
MKERNLFDYLTQFIIPGLTISAQTAIAFKYPQWGLVINMLAQPFWIYSGWKAYKKAGQVGLFATTIIMTIIIAFGVVNYWFL